jgi:putative transposase
MMKSTIEWGSIRITLEMVPMLEHSINKQIMKYSKRKEQFPNEESLECFLVSQFDLSNQQFSIHFYLYLGFDQARTELTAMFKEE